MVLRVPSLKQPPRRVKGPASQEKACLGDMSLRFLFCRNKCQPLEQWGASTCVEHRAQ